MPILHQPILKQERARWRPASQEYYGPIVSIGNSISEAYPKKCCGDWKPPNDVDAKLSKPVAPRAAGRSSISVRKDSYRKNTNVLSSSLVSMNIPDVSENLDFVCWNETRKRSDVITPAGLRVSRVLPYPII